MNALPALHVRIQPIRLLCCNLCGKIFDSSDDLVMHFAMHFAPGECLHCKEQLVEIRDTVYHLQLTAPCERKPSNNWDCEASAVNVNIKSEPEPEQLEVPDRFYGSPISHDADVSYSENVIEDKVMVRTSAVAASAITRNETPQETNSIVDFTWPDYPDDSDSDNGNGPVELIKCISDGSSIGTNTTKKRRYRRRMPFKPRVRTQDRHRRTYECYVCKMSMEAFNRMPMERHLRGHYESKRSGKPTCEICGKQYSTEGNLRVHMGVHSGRKRYICSFCGRGFNQRSNLVDHIICHTGTKNHKCDLCGKLFGRRTNLNHHQLVHTGERPHKCSVEGCDRAYMYSIDLKRHLYGQHRIYTKKFECKVCGKVLPENKLLVAHMKTH